MKNEIQKKSNNLTSRSGQVKSEIIQTNENDNLNIQHKNYKKVKNKGSISFFNDTNSSQEKIKVNLIKLKKRDSEKDQLQNCIPIASTLMQNDNLNTINSQIINLKISKKTSILETNNVNNFLTTNDQAVSDNLLLTIYDKNKKYFQRNEKGLEIINENKENKMNQSEIIHENKKVNLFDTNCNVGRIVQSAENLKNDGLEHSIQVIPIMTYNQPKKKGNFIHAKGNQENRSETKNLEEVKICKVCYDNEEKDNKLINPCLCQGTMMFIHESCLKKWIDKHFGEKKNKANCEICQYIYKQKFFAEYYFSCTKASAALKGMASVIVVTLIVLILVLIIVYTVISSVLNLDSHGRNILNSILFSVGGLILLFLMIYLCKDCKENYCDKELGEWKIYSVNEKVDNSRTEIEQSNHNSIIASGEQGNR